MKRIPCAFYRQIAAAAVNRQINEAAKKKNKENIR